MYTDVILRQKGKFSDMLFTYKIPEYLEDDIRPGHRVSVPFGMGNKPKEAIVVNISQSLKEGISESKIKDVVDILDEKPLITRDNLRLLVWIRNRYICTYNDSLSLFFPKGYSIKASKKVRLRPRLYEGDELEIKEDEKELLDFLEENPDYDYEALAKLYPKALIARAKKKRYILIDWTYDDKKNIKKERIILLTDNPENLKTKIKEEKIRLGSKQKEVLNFLYENPEVAFRDLSELFNVTLSTIKSLEKKELIKIEYEVIVRNVDTKFDYEEKEIVLNEEQKNVVEEIISSFERGEKQPFLLHGITGSGKTEIYLEIIEYMLSQGLDSLFLVPEIALTPQMIARVRARFGSLVGVYHSMLSEGEKSDVFREIRDGNTRVVIGTRSAIFLPFDTLGLIVIDEEHEGSYKSEKAPKYDAIEVARYMSIKQGISLVLGSATPSISDYYRANQGEFKILRVNQRANAKPRPEFEVIDMREELNSGNKNELSNRLLEEIEKTVDSKSQVILFLNRRGYANFVNCKSCGHVFKCDRCDITLTYHKYNNRGVCHYCGHEEDIPKACPECEAETISPMGLGTEKIEEFLKSKYPDYRVLRIDRDTTSKKGDLERILNKFNNQEADILIGTQMLSKGHDFRNVTLVGIVSADMMLNFPDYRAFESTFQLITQVAGRAGRGDKKGRVLLQTYDTDHFAIQRAIDYDYEGFYKDEIRLRQAFGYEPFSNIVKMVFTGKNVKKVEFNAKKAFDTIKYLFESKNISVESAILGPNECSISKINDRYRWQILIKDINIDVRELKSMVKYVCITKYDEIFDSGINISIEMNPNSYI